MGNILNLVFDKWNGDNPIPNLTFLNEKLGREAISNTEVDSPLHFLVNLGKDLVINETIYDSFTWVVLGCFGIAGAEKFAKK